MMTLTQIQHKYRDIAASLGCEGTLPITPQHDGSAHAEHIGDNYFFMVTERGRELKRQQTTDPEELLSWFVRGLTASIARGWELQNRVSSQDSRRLWFKKHVALLQEINPAWAKEQACEYEDVLVRHPFDDAVRDSSESLRSNRFDS